MTPIREQIIQAVLSRLAIIRTANGFNTNAGANVKRASRYVDVEELPAVIVWPRKEEADPNYGTHPLTMPIDIELYAEQLAASTPSEQSELMLADIIEAALGMQWVYAFTDGVAEPSAGDTITGRTSEAEALIQSVTLASGTWAGGDAAGTVTARRVSGVFEAETVEDGDGAALFDLTAAAPTITGPKDLFCVGLVRGVFYVGGGTDDYPDSEDSTASVSATFHIRYVVAAGDPYHQNR